MGSEDTSLSNDAFLELLQFGKQKGLDGVSFRALFEFGRKIGYLTESEFNEIINKPPHEVHEGLAHEKKFALTRIFDETFHACHTVDGNRILSVDSYFKLLEHDELVLARENAKSARWFSIAAIAISFISLLTAFYLSNQPIHVENEQYKEIVMQFETQSEKLDVLIERTEKIKSALTQSRNK